MPLTGALFWIVTSPDPGHSAKLLWAVPTRLGRDIVTAGAIAADYHFSLRGLEPGSLERQEAKSACHMRCADRLQQLFFKNGGIYIKLGQHIGQLDYLLPPEYVQTMRRVMLDKCPTSSYDQVRSIFQAELGHTPEKLFADFEEKPFASASLAQVHVARLHSGQKVAVKVQHGHLTDTAAADTATVALVVQALYWFYPNFDYRWLIDEVRESLPQELDFTREANNALQCAANFQSGPLRGHVAVPAAQPALSSRRVLTMDFMDGVGVTDVAAIERLGLKPADVAKLVSQTFAEMIFHHGFVHCDPHAANLLVRPMPQGGGRPKPQLVLLDHGLYRTVSPYLRFHYASLWKALVFADVKQVKEHSVAMGAGEDLYVLFAAVLTMRTWTNIQDPSLTHLMVTNTPKERAEIQANAAKFVNEVSELLRRLPRVVLLLLKTNDCLRSVDLALGAAVNTFVIIGRKCVRALADIQVAEHPGAWSQLRATWRVWHAELRIMNLQATAWLAGWKQSFDSWFERRDLAVRAPSGA